MGNPKVRELANLLGRTPGSVSMKLSNFARLDPALQARGIVGLQRGAKGEKEIWDGYRAGQIGACEIYSADQAFPIHELYVSL